VPQSWCLYALGGGGGHVTRAYALARAAARLGHRSKILARGNIASLLAIPMRSEAARSGSEIDIELMPMSLDAVGASSWVQAQLESRNFDRLIVDSFPRGLVGELAPLLSRLPVRKFLVARHMNATFAAKPEIVEALKAYEHLLVPGEETIWQSHCRHTVTAPWFVRDAAEIPASSSVRASLGMNMQKRVAVFVGTGTLDEVNELHAVALAAKARTSSHVIWLSPTDATSWPAMNVLAAADVAVGSAGYNLVNECRALGVPLLCRVKDRLYDEQEKRVASEQRWFAAEDLLMKLDRIPFRTPTTAGFNNGAHAASHVLSSAETATSL
jgi:hypothetical protein